MTDRIHLVEVQLNCRIGVTEAERAVPQTLLADVTLETDIRAAARTDDVAQTIDYVAVLDLLREVAAERHFALVETFIEVLAARILAETPALAVRLLIRKPTALRDRGVAAAAVEIERRRDG